MINLSDHNPKKNIPSYVHEFSEDEPDFATEIEVRSLNPKGPNATDFRQEI
jgi:hypothetical protein